MFLLKFIFRNKDENFIFFKLFGTPYVYNRRENKLENYGYRKKIFPTFFFKREKKEKKNQEKYILLKYSGTHYLFNEKYYKVHIPLDKKLLISSDIFNIELKGREKKVVKRLTAKLFNSYSVNNIRWDLKNIKPKVYREKS